MWRLKVLTIFIATAVSAVATCQRLGDLVVTPTRLVLDDKARAGDITLLNKGSQTVRYRLTLVDMEMSEDGVLRRVESGSRHSAKNILRLSPREIVLQPGESQRIKVLVTFPAGLADGELRSHLSFEPISIPKLRPDQGTSEGSIKLNLEIKAVVTIPVIARHGRLAAAASINSAAVGHDGDGWFTKFKIDRAGNRSIRGDLTVSFVPASGGPKVLLGMMSGLAVYVPNSSRIVTVRLAKDVAALGKGDIEVTFSETSGARDAVVAKAKAVLGDQK
jgi:P pilus assembly chaperone PapD